MDQTLSRVAESLGRLLDHRDAGEAEADGGGGRLRPRPGRSGRLGPSPDSLPSYEQLSSSPSSFSSSNGAAFGQPSLATAANQEGC